MYTGKETYCASNHNLSVMDIYNHLVATTVAECKQIIPSGFPTLDSYPGEHNGGLKTEMVDKIRDDVHQLFAKSMLRSLSAESL